MKPTTFDGRIVDAYKIVGGMRFFRLVNDPGLWILDPDFEEA
jgi:hypothetical protein